MKRTRTRPLGGIIEKPRPWPKNGPLVVLLVALLALLWYLVRRLG